jgi:hypothetical protein
MSNTKRDVTPGWNPSDPHWCYGNMTEKYQARDRSEGKCKSSKNHRFTKGIKNTKYNLQQKIEDLSLEEELSLV